MDVKRLLRRLDTISSLLSYVGSAALFCMMILTTLDVAGRYLFNSPILGVFEMTEFLVLILIFSFVAYAQSSKTHVAVELLVAQFPHRLQVYIADLIRLFASRKENSDS